MYILLLLALGLCYKSVVNYASTVTESLLQTSIEALHSAQISKRSKQRTVAMFGRRLIHFMEIGFKHGRVRFLRQTLAEKRFTVFSLTAAIERLAT